MDTRNMRLTETEKAEIERLASLAATARCIRARYRAGAYKVPGTTQESIEARVERASAALTNYLNSL